MRQPCRRSAKRQQWLTAAYDYWRRSCEGRFWSNMYEHLMLFLYDSISNSPHFIDDTPSE